MNEQRIHQLLDDGQLDDVRLARDADAKQDDREARIAELEAENAALREVIAPFAAVAADAERLARLSDLAEDQVIPIALTIRDFCRIVAPILAAQEAELAIAQAEHRCHTLHVRHGQ